MGIINCRRRDLAGYRFEVLSEGFRDSLLKQTENHFPYAAESMTRSLYGFECFCQVYGQSIVEYRKYASKNRNVIETFCLYVAAGQIFKRSHACNVGFARMFLKSATSLPYIGCSDWSFSERHSADEYRSFLNPVSDLVPDERLLKFWRGWPSKNKSNKSRYFPLQMVHEYCGHHFCEKLYTEMDLFNRAKTRTVHRSWHLMIQKFADRGRLGTLERLLEPAGSRQFFDDLLIAFLSSGVESSVKVEYATLALEWRNNFAPFVQEHLIPAKIVAAPLNGFPLPKLERKSGLDTNVRPTEKGDLVKCKLLTEIPLHISDKEAIRLLFNEIANDIDLLESWANFRVDRVWKNYTIRKQCASDGTVIPLKIAPNAAQRPHAESKKWLTSRENPDRHKNLCATFEHLGFLSRSDGCLKTVYGSFSEAAVALGLPDIVDFIAVHTLLIIQHPELTQSSLWSLEAYDEKGHLVCLETTDAGTYLVCYKKRRGPKLAQQKILLTRTSHRLMRKALKLTEPLREYLKNKGDPAWTKMCLSRGAGFSYPRHITKGEIANSPAYQRAFRADIDALRIYAEAVDRLAKAFTLTKLRASVAVQIYLETASVNEMSKALGHHKYNKSLVDRYLPQPIRHFFEERWVRIFQAGIVCEATKNTKHQLVASGFKNVAELDAFLREHVIDFPETPTTTDTASVDESRILFALNEPTLELFLAMERKDQFFAQKGQDTLYKLWCGVVARLLNLIRSPDYNRPDIKAMLQTLENTAGTLSEAPKS